MRRFLYLFLICGLLSTICFSRAAEFGVKAGEIRLDGTVRSVDASANIVVMDATTYGLPNGKSTRLTAPKTKNVEIGTATRLHVRGDEKRAVSISSLLPGTFLIVIGKDAGSGKNLPAREIAVWEQEKSGKYFFGPAATPPKTKIETKPVTNIKPLGESKPPPPAAKPQQPENMTPPVNATPVRPAISEPLASPANEPAANAGE
jgi:hypothetical protein